MRMLTAMQECHDPGPPIQGDGRFHCIFMYLNAKKLTFFSVFFCFCFCYSLFLCGLRSPFCQRYHMSPVVLSNFGITAAPCAAKSLYIPYFGFILADGFRNGVHSSYFSEVQSYIAIWWVWWMVVCVGRIFLNIPQLFCCYIFNFFFIDNYV